MQTESILERWVNRIERANVLDRPAALLELLASQLARSDSATRALAGAPLGHRLHPMLTDVPIGCWTSASVLDLTTGGAAHPAARRLVAFGIVASLPTAASGLFDWLSTREGDRRVGVVHAAGNFVSLGLQVASYSARRRGKNARGAIMGIASLGVATAAGYLGGHMVFARRVGVEVGVPDIDEGWHTIGTRDELVEGEAIEVEVDGAKVAVVQLRGMVYAMAGVCNHAGGPLGRGTVAGQSLTCPWHGSRFCLADGRVMRGPAAAPQPAYDTRVRGDIVEIRRRSSTDHGRSNAMVSTTAIADEQRPRVSTRRR
jgi:nitrite reductase/ring-hydroxylating ferredoxin subunit/uncharacterized membrane protein